MKLTLKEFNELSPEQQESYINSDDFSGLEQREVTIDSLPVVPNIAQKESGLAIIPSENGPEIQAGIVDELPVLSTIKPEEPSTSTQSVSILAPDGFDIADPVELLFLLDDDIISGRVQLHDWQVQFMLDFAAGGTSDRNPFQAVMRACNGSGKDKFIIAACVVWLCMRYKKSRAIVTSSSGVQLDNQTCAYITMLANQANRKWGQVWKCNYRAYLCLATESPIVCYATDEPGKAEGFHPLEFGRKMGIFASEDKTIPDEINAAIDKCTGYTHRVHVSTPGLPMGHFYNLCSTAVNRKSIKSVHEVKPTDYIHYHIVASMCPHLSSHYIEQMKRDLPGGEFGAAFKSQVLAEFGTTDEMVVIPYDHVWRAVNRSLDKWIPEAFNKAGLDLADGGDETVLAIRNGNRLLKIIPFKFDNADETESFLNEQFKENNLSQRESYIFADCGGIGKPMLDHLKRKMGWKNIIYRDNRAKTSRPKTYKNWGAQSWFELAKLLQNNEIILPKDNKLIRQLSTRYYKIIDGQVHQLLSKIESRSRGYPSPDRADAVVLAFSDFDSTYVSPLESEDKPYEIVEEEDKIVSEFTLKSHANGNNSKWGKWNVNDNQKDFRELESEIEQYNKNLVLMKRN